LLRYAVELPSLKLRSETKL